jgi:hypothetical protein
MRDCLKPPNGLVMKRRGSNDDSMDGQLYLLHMKNVQRFAGAPRGLYRSQDLFANLQVRAVYAKDVLKKDIPALDSAIKQRLRKVINWLLTLCGLAGRCS